jgi:hypothetical protein
MAIAPSPTADGPLYIARPVIVAAAIRSALVRRGQPGNGSLCLGDDVRVFYTPRQVVLHLVDVAPSPALARLDRSDDGVV